jgi:hypothetical protein
MITTRKRMQTQAPPRTRVTVPKRTHERTP